MLAVQTRAPTAARSDGATSAPDEQKLDTFAFWEPLDEAFVTAMVHYARSNDFAVVSPFNTENFFAYQAWTPTLDAESPAQVEASHDKLVTAAENAGTVSATGGAWEAAISGSAPGAGYYEVAADGGIFAFGDAGYFGSMGGKPLDQPIVGLAATPGGGGYWEVAADGGIFAFGDAGFYGSMGGKPLDQPIVGMAATPDGGGYWEVAADGGIFAFGDAGFYGSMGGKPLDQPIVGLAATPDGGGYWEVAADGGDLRLRRRRVLRLDGRQAARPALVGLAATPDGGGYWEVAADGGSSPSATPGSTARWAASRSTSPSWAWPPPPIGAATGRWRPTGALRLRRRRVLRLDGRQAARPADRGDSPRVASMGEGRRAGTNAAEGERGGIAMGEGLTGGGSHR